MSQINKEVALVVNMNNQLKKALEDYCIFFGEDKIKFLPIFESIDRNSNLQDRKNMQGHLASQGFLFNKDFSKVLLLHHKSLDMWIQPGGHMDPEDIDLVKATKREVLEETGLQDCTYLPVDVNNPLMPICISINTIPANLKKTEGEHYHFDLAYVFVTENEDINIDISESNNCKWISFKEFKLNKNFKMISLNLKNLDSFIT
jgi:8-oxo-dGTP pyrophosphatase MutT (NUDIX family)